MTCVHFTTEINRPKQSTQLDRFRLCTTISVSKWASSSNEIGSKRVKTISFSIGRLGTTGSITEGRCTYLLWPRIRASSSICFVNGFSFFLLQSKLVFFLHFTLLDIVGIETAREYPRAADTTGNFFAFPLVSVSYLNTPFQWTRILTNFCPVGLSPNPFAWQYNIPKHQLGHIKECFVTLSASGIFRTCHPVLLVFCWEIKGQEHLSKSNRTNNIFRAIFFHQEEYGYPFVYSRNFSGGKLLEPNHFDVSKINSSLLESVNLVVHHHYYVLNETIKGSFDIYLIVVSIKNTKSCCLGFPTFTLLLIGPKPVVVL